MTGSSKKRGVLREKFAQFGALGYLLVLGGVALAGPSGVLAWGEQLSLIDKYQTRLTVLREQRDELQNRVGLLDPQNVDADLATELFRQKLNVVHPDEYIIVLDDAER